MEKVITIIAEVAVAALVLAGLIILTSFLMDANTDVGIYKAMMNIINGVMDDVKTAIGL